MAISYTCPNCGKQYTVADQYAGQTGPCASCGKPITIPFSMPAGGYAPKPSTGGGSGIVVAVVVCVVLLLVCPGILIALLLPAVFSARTAAQRMNSSNNLKQIGLAIHSYHDMYKAFPPAVVTDANGQPLYSGRVLLLPFLEHTPLYEQFDKTQAWDSPTNLPISQMNLPVFMDQSNTSPLPGETNYLFVTGPNTIFEAGRAGANFADVTDGLSNTMMVVEAKGMGVRWAEPRDLTISGPTSLPAGHHENTNLVLIADGSVQMVSQSTAPATIHALATRNGGETNTLP